MFTSRKTLSENSQQLPAGDVLVVIIISLKFGAEFDPLITAVEKIKLLLDRICLFWNLK